MNLSIAALRSHLSRIRWRCQQVETYLQKGDLTPELRADLESFDRLSLEALHEASKTYISLAASAGIDVKWFSEYYGLATRQPAWQPSYYSSQKVTDKSASALADSLTSQAEHTFNAQYVSDKTKARASLVALAEPVFLLDQRQALEFERLRATHRFPPDLLSQWKFSWARERRDLSELLIALLARGTFLTGFIYGALRFSQSTDGWGKFAFWLFLILALDQAKLFGISFYRTSAKTQEAESITSRVTAPIGCIGAILPFSPLGLAIQVVGLVAVGNAAVKGLFLLFGDKDRARMDYSPIVSKVLLGTWLD